MRVKTSVTLPSELLAEIDRIEPNRSALIERATRTCLNKIAYQEREERDQAILNQYADEINEEAAAFLEFQEIP